MSTGRIIKEAHNEAGLPVHSMDAISMYPVFERSRFFTDEGYAHHLMSIYSRRLTLDGIIKEKRKHNYPTRKEKR